MPYIKEVARAGKTIEIRKYYSARYGHHEPNGPKKKPTTEAAKRAFLRKQETDLRRLMNTNFRDTVDALVTLEWKRGRGPETSEEIQKEVQKFIRRLRARYKAAGKELRYIYTIEVGPRGSRHVHMVVSSADLMELTECWNGIAPDVKALYTNGQYADIAKYFMKYALKTEETEGRKLGRRFNCSHNLKKPVVRKTIVLASTFRKKIREKKGWYIDKKSRRSGVSEMTGLAYLEYTYIRGPNPEPEEEKEVEEG